MAGEIILVSGPARSGKSEFAEELVKRLAVKAAENAGAGALPESAVAYLATAWAGDGEMASRIAGHRARRPAAWLTKEETLYPAEALAEACREGRTVVLLDSLTMLLNNWLCHMANEPDGQREGAPGRVGPEFTERECLRRVMPHIEHLFAEARKREDLRLVIVTDEAGWGLIPDNALGRLYRDLAGGINRRAAALADQVWLVVMGLPRRLK